ncbi:MAG: chitobiase/beta-hexosaminidase C-terminal domain-containing protein [Phycisphaerae bacterium]
MCRKLFGMVLGLVMALTVSIASAGVLYYDDGSTVTGNWLLTDCTLTSDGDVLRELSSDAGYAILNLGFPAPVDELTVVFDFKIVNPGAFLATYLSPPGEGLLIVNWWVAKCSHNQVGFMDNLKPDTWYSIAIYSKGSAGYQAFWIAEGKQVNLWNISRTYEAGWSPWTGTSNLTFYAWANPTYPSAEWFFDDIRVNSGIDLTGGNPVPVATPVFTPRNMVISGPTPITITCATAGSSIYYTTDGTTPTTASALYTGPVTVNPGTTLTAKAFAGELKPSQRAVTYMSPTIPILGWNGVPAASNTVARYQELREAGFTHNFTTYGSFLMTQEVLDAAAEAGIRIMTNPIAPVASFVPQFKDHPAFAGYFLQDEPSTADFASLASQVQTIQALDTENFCYINLFPDYATSGQLGAPTYQSYVDSFVNTVPVDLLTFDHYPISTGSGYTPGFYQNLETISAAARAKGIPFWAFARAVSWDDFCLPTLPHLRFQMFSNLAYGAQGLEYFTYWQPINYGGIVWHDSPINSTGQRTATWYVVQSMNQEIKQLSNVFLGAQVIRLGHTGSSIPSGTTSYSPASPVVSLTTTGSEGAVVSEMNNGQNKYLVVVNRDIFNTMTLNITLETSRGIFRVNKDGTVTALPGATVQYTVDPADIVILRTAGPGDVNGDGTVDGVDMQIVLAAMDSKSNSGNWDARADLDSDGEVTSTDLSIVLANMP